VIAGLLLAAGRSSRFGADKLCAKLDGKAVIRWSATSLLSAVDVVYVVVAPGADAPVQALSRMDVRFVVNLAHAEGMASSIRAGVAALPADVEAVVIALGDQPRVSAEVMRALIARWREGNADAVAPRYDEGRGNPVLFARSCFAALLTLRGDVGARAVLEALGSRAAEVPVPGSIPVDVDTPEALDALQRSNRL
jgi:molybdenum cofactor cytidylyltransferase